MPTTMEPDSVPCMPGSNIDHNSSALVPHIDMHDNSQSTRPTQTITQSSSNASLRVPTNIPFSSHGPYPMHMPLPHYSPLPPYSLLSSHNPLPSYDPVQSSSPLPAYVPLPTTYSPLPTTYVPLTTTYGPLPTTYSPLPTTYGPLTTTFGPLTTTYGPLTTTFGPLTTTYGSMTTTYGSLTTTFGPLTTTYGPLPAEYGPIPIYGSLQSHGSVPVYGSLQSHGPMPAENCPMPPQTWLYPGNIPYCVSQSPGFIGFPPQMPSPDDNEAQWQDPELQRSYYGDFLSQQEAQWQTPSLSGDMLFQKGYFDEDEFKRDIGADTFWSQGNRGTGSVTPTSREVNDVSYGAVTPNQSNITTESPSDLANVADGGSVFPNFLGPLAKGKNDGGQIGSSDQINADERATHEIFKDIVTHKSYCDFIPSIVRHEVLPPLQAYGESDTKPSGNIHLLSPPSRPTIGLEEAIQAMSISAQETGAENISALSYGSQSIIEKCLFKGTDIPTTKAYQPAVAPNELPKSAESDITDEGPAWEDEEGEYDSDLERTINQVPNDGMDAATRGHLAQQRYFEQRPPFTGYTQRTRDQLARFRAAREDSAEHKTDTNLSPDKNPRDIPCVDSPAKSMPESSQEASNSLDTAFFLSLFEQPGAKEPEGLGQEHPSRRLFNRGPQLSESASKEIYEPAPRPLLVGGYVVSSPGEPPMAVHDYFMVDSVLDSKSLEVFNKFHDPDKLRAQAVKAKKTQKLKSKNPQKQGPVMCSHCKNQNRPYRVYTSHRLRDPITGHIECPYVD